MLLVGWLVAAVHSLFAVTPSQRSKLAARNDKVTTAAQQPGCTRICEHIKYTISMPRPACITCVTHNTARRPARYNRGKNEAPSLTVGTL